MDNSFTNVGERVNKKYPLIEKHVCILRSQIVLQQVTLLLRRHVKIVFSVMQY